MPQMCKVVKPPREILRRGKTSSVRETEGYMERLSLYKDEQTQSSFRNMDDLFLNILDFCEMRVEKLEKQFIDKRGVISFLRNVN